MTKKLFFGPVVLIMLILTSACNAPETIVTDQPETETSAPAEATSAATEPTAPAVATIPATTAAPPTEDSATAVPSEPAPTLEPGAELEIAFIHMVDRASGWAIGGVDGGRDHVLYTVDGAETFRDVTPPVGSQLSMGIEKWAVGAFLDDQIAHILYFPAILEPGPPSGSELVIWSTDDGGSSWKASEAISSSVVGTQDFPPRLFFINADEGWFMARNGGAGMHRYPVSLYRTSDGAATWDPLIEAMGASELQSCRKTGWAFGDASNGLTTIDNCPVDGPAIERTVDGGSTWERVILPPPAEEPETVSNAYCETFSPTFVQPDLVLLAADCTAYDDPNTERSLLYRSADAGQTWDAWDFPGGSLFFLDETRGFALSREIHWTADGGITWEQEKTVSWDGQFSFVDADVGWAIARADDEVALVKTEDRGQTWRIIEPMLER